MAAAARPRRARPNPLFGLVRASAPGRARARAKARGPSRRELAEQVRNARARADRAIRRLERAGTEYEIEQAIRLGRHALRHLESVEGKAYAGGADEPGRGLFGAFRRGGAPDAGLARLLEQAQDRLAVRREYERRGRRRALDVATGRATTAGVPRPATAGRGSPPRAARGRHEAKTREFAPVSEREREAAERQAKAAAARAERERERAKRAAERGLQAAFRKEQQQAGREEARRYAEHEREVRARERERGRHDTNAALRHAHTGRKLPRGHAEEAPLEEGEDPRAALGFNPPRRPSEGGRSPLRRRAAKGARRARRR